MRTAIILALAGALLAACNLNSEAPLGPTLPPTFEAATADAPTSDPNQPTALPGVLPPQTPGVLPTRTPFGNALPTPLPAIGGPVSAGTPQALPTSETGESAAITSPANGSNVQVGVLQVSGVVIGLPDDAFDLILTDSTGRVLNSQHITLQNPNAVAEVPWSASMTTGAYTGPAQVEVIGRTALDREQTLARIDINLVNGPASNTGGSLPASSGVGVGGRTTTPAGNFSSPAPNAVVPSGSIQVNGAAGGIPDNQFVVVLVGPGDNVINSQLVTLSNDDYTNVVPWSVALGTSGYHGPAEIRAFATVNGAQVLLATVSVRIE